jgi:hypothetical protein
MRQGENIKRQLTERLTKQEIEFYRKHPELVRAVGDKKSIYRVVLVVVFVAGFVLVAISKAVKFGLVESPDSAVAELVIDLIFEMGVALWGGVATTVLLQSYVERKYKEGRRYQQDIMRLLAEEEKEKGEDS